jgi:hypothetical protein
MAIIRPSKNSPVRQSVPYIYKRGINDGAAFLKEVVKLLD